jgi:hypothetical protein
MPYQREAEIVIAMWRDVERQLSEAAPGSAEREALEADASRLRTEYLRLIAAAREAHRPEPPPFPES